MLQLKNVCYAPAHPPMTTGTKEQGVTLRYDLTFEAAGAYIIRAPSGAGKSTLLDLVAGFLKPTAGEILWQGQPLHLLATSKRPLSYVPQNGVVFEALSVERNLAFTGATDADIAEVLAALDISQTAQQKAGSLSGGQRQRLLLATVLLQRRPIVLLDEPFQGLDEGTKNRVLDCCNDRFDLATQLILMATHEDHAYDLRGSKTVMM